MLAEVTLDVNAPSCDANSPDRNFHKTMQTLRDLQYLVRRLRRVGEDECRNAAQLVEAAIPKLSRGTLSLKAQHDLFQTVGDHVSRALDSHSISLDQRDELNALEAEMAGRVLTAKLELESW
ncbi:hypothetical protein [Burkholderia glumae]|uniref:hypothetical protein n=1 Tax=Burkholderia glumae TaxID=337 RepID=UPI00156F5136|nr:hypothetical protein [Burkholderia glumae]